MKAFLDAGATVIAEDLGVVPDFVRESQHRLGIPGYKVFRWERDWELAGPAVQKSAKCIRRYRSQRPALTTPRRWWNGGKPRLRRNGAKVAELPFHA